MTDETRRAIAAEARSPFMEPLLLAAATARGFNRRRRRVLPCPRKPARRR